MALPSALRQGGRQFYLSNIYAQVNSFLHCFQFSPSQPTLLCKATSPAYSASRAHQQGIKHFPSLQLNTRSATFLLTLLLLCILFNKPPATLDVRNKEMAGNLFIPADQLETWTQIRIIISKTPFLVFCSVVCI